MSVAAFQYKFCTFPNQDINSHFLSLRSLFHHVERVRLGRRGEWDSSAHCWHFYLSATTGFLLAISSLAISLPRRGYDIAAAPTALWVSDPDPPYSFSQCVSFPSLSLEGLAFLGLHLGFTYTHSIIYKGHRGFSTSIVPKNFLKFD